MQSISKFPFQHCVCLPSLPHLASLPGLACLASLPGLPGLPSLPSLPSLPGLAGQTAGKKSEKLLHHMSRSHGRRATPWREHKAILQWLFILTEPSFQCDMNFKWLKPRSSHYLNNFVNKWLEELIAGWTAGHCTHRSSATWSYLLLCLITTSDHTIIETF